MIALVTGAAGQLGRDLVPELRRRGHEVLACDLSGAPVSLDIVDREAVRELVQKSRPDAVLHCAAWTQVDAAEQPENRARVFAVNEAGTRNLADACRETGAKMLYLSTDYVFSGRGEEPWTPEETVFSPLNVYGESKLAGERALRERLTRFFIVRTAWVFGPQGKNFPDTMLRLSSSREALRVVSDQIGTPTYTPDLSRLLADMIETERFGVYHATNEGGYVSWADYAREIFRQAGKKTRVIPVTTEEYGESLARRPKNSRLSKEKLRAAGFSPLPPWRDALTRYLTGRRASEPPPL